MLRFTYFLLLSFMFISLNSCKESNNSSLAIQDVISFKKEGSLHLIQKESDSILKTIDIEVARDEFEIQTGLMYRNDLGTSQGMLFIFPEESHRSFYMKNTRLPLDIIYISASKEIVSIIKNAKPFDETSLPSDLPAQYVLEINGGLADEWQIGIGDTIKFELY
ncbi:MAG: DUF192 domain-containing protein [Winogradskyella sp.]|nr:DUF192 domain-containing protein [Winogradskyella sp.]MBT8375304.1 DUF192 domain-containing protein [Bacteroidia bacterium]NNC45161.1 DUF192 domain-containing protein [Winogradskyella sp.]NNF86751.1 DUF192 domain-containing protein [Winogradskyella sp.]NNL83552.1 DUF192 domain-containing protein [Winogradskyella sp.]